jgi:hypothetical protein
MDQRISCRLRPGTRRLRGRLARVSGKADGGRFSGWARRTDRAQICHVAMPYSDPKIVPSRKRAKTYRIVGAVRINPKWPKLNYVVA